MAPSTTTGFDVLPFLAAVVSVAVLGGYVGIMRDQGDAPVAWFVAGVGIAGIASGYAAWGRAPHRKIALTTAGVLLVACGILGLFSIGLPLVVAGVLAFVARARVHR